MTNDIKTGDNFQYLRVKKACNLGFSSMKKKILFLIYFLQFFQVLYSQDKITLISPVFIDELIVFDFPYFVDDEVERIFKPDTPLAIDILEIIADGEKLSYINDLSMEIPDYKRSFWMESQDRILDRDEYSIRTFWRGYYGGIVWNDGQGVIFKEIVPDIIHLYTNSYKIEYDTQVVTVRYRIRFPMTHEEEEIFSDETEFLYSDEYLIAFDMSNIWKEPKSPSGITFVPPGQTTKMTDYVIKAISDPELEKQLMAMDLFGVTLNDTVDEVKVKMEKVYGELSISSHFERSVFISPIDQDPSKSTRGFSSNFFDGKISTNIFHKKNSDFFSYLKEVIPYEFGVTLIGESLMSGVWEFETVRIHVFQDGDEYDYGFYNKVVRKELFDFRGFSGTP